MLGGDEFLRRRMPDFLSKKKIGHSQLRRNSPAREDANRFVVATGAPLKRGEKGKARCPVASSQPCAPLKRGKRRKTEVSGSLIQVMCTPEKREKGEGPGCPTAASKQEAPLKSRKRRRTGVPDRRIQAGSTAEK